MSLPLDTLAGALVAAGATGLVGSLHCAAMCGPLASASCGGPDRPIGARARSGALYFVGRLVSYATVGAVMGSIGGRLGQELHRHALCEVPLRWIEGLAVAAVALTALAQAARALRPPGGRSDRPIPARALRRRRDPAIAFLAALVPRRGLGLGLVTGVLPCGMLAPAWLLAASTLHPIGGAAVMLVFALASAPGLLLAMLGASLAARLLPSSPRVRAGAWALLAVLVLARPLLANVHHHP